MTRGKNTKWGNLSQKVSVKRLPKGFNRRAISYMKRKRVLESRGIMTEGYRRMFVVIVSSMVKRGNVKELMGCCAKYF